MKRALIVASVGILASTVWAVSANAQANINPNLYPNNTSERYGAQPWEWYASVGPVRRGKQCVVDVDINRGYGFMKDCPAPQASTAPRRPASRTARHHRKSSSS